VLEKLTRPRGYRREPTDVFDHSVITDRFHIARIEVPYPSLMRISGGGIAPAELWYIAARFGQGKSWEAHGYGACAAKAGYSVGLLSCEMPAAQVGMRVLRRLAGRDATLHRMLSSDQESQRKEAADTIAGMTDGRVNVFDPSHGRINTVAAVHDLCEEYDFVIVDHVGLMQDATGKRAVDDWRVMGAISNQLRELTLETNTPVLGVAQINREGARSGPWTPPKADNLSQSDFLGMDADVIITMKRAIDGGRVLVHRTAKMRDAPQVKWYTRFEPGRGLFTEITFELANELYLEDKASNTDD
jgi:replicative DNA helicase